MMFASSIVHTSALWKILAASFGAGAVIAFGFVLLGASRYAQARSGTATGTRRLPADGRNLGRAVHGSGRGIIAMTHK